VIGAVIAVVAIVLALGVAGVLPLGLHASNSGSSAPEVRVDSAVLHFDPSNTPCFTSAYQDSKLAVYGVGGIATYRVNLTDDAHGSVRACTVTGINVSTTGFSLASANVPLVINASGTTLLTIVVNLPTSAFLGTLNLTATVTDVPPNVVVGNQTLSFSPASNSCGSLMQFGSAGFSGFSGGMYNDSLGFSVISPPQSCNVTSVSTSTPGFSIVSSQTPASLPIDSILSVSFVVQLPEGPYQGDLDITFHLD
jgi:hypothetical protein